MACRTLLLKLELQGYITLPRRRSPGRGCRKVSIPYVPHNTASIACSLSALKPVQIQLVEDTGLLRLFQCLLSAYHYAVFDLALGQGSTPSQPYPGKSGQADQRGLAGEIRSSPLSLGNLCGTATLSRHLLPGSQLDLCRSNQRAQPQRPLCHP